LCCVVGLGSRKSREIWSSGRLALAWLPELNREQQASRCPGPPHCFHSVSHDCAIPLDCLLSTVHCAARLLSVRCCVLRFPVCCSFPDTRCRLNAHLDDHLTVPTLLSPLTFHSPSFPFIPPHLPSPPFGRICLGLGLQASRAGVNTPNVSLTLSPPGAHCDHVDTHGCSAGSTQGSFQRTARSTAARSCPLARAAMGTAQFPAHNRCSWLVGRPLARVNNP
jgi:hypothetical protein